MKKLVIILLLTFALVPKIGSSVEQRAKVIAEEYYSSFQRLAQMSDPYGDEGAQLENRIIQLAGKAEASEGMTGVSGLLRISNDIYPILGLVNSGKSDVSINKYVGDFRKYAFERDFGYSYKLVSCEQLEQPSFKGVKNDIQFADVLVRKTYFFQNKSVDVDETMTITFLKNRYFMSSIKNQFGTAQTSGDMFALALQYYTNRQYKEALKTFEDCIKKHDNNAAKYYASIMYLQNQGCKGMKREDRDEKAVNYLIDLKRQWDDAFKTSLNTGNIENEAQGIEIDESLLFPYKAVSLLGILGVY